MTSFRRWLTITASTQRPAVDGSGLTTSIASLSVMPLMPVDPEVAERFDVRTVRESKVTYCQVADVQEGDRLIVSGTSYVVRAVGEWSWDWDGDKEFLEIIIEEIK